MILPRRLFLLADGQFCEEDNEKQAMNFRPKGFIIPDGEAERIGLTAYLEKTGWGDTARDPDHPATEAESKAVAQAEVEDKAVTMAAPDEKAVEPEPSSEAEELPPGLHIPQEGRRGGGRRGA
jgi:hypothetical protein